MDVKIGTRVGRLIVIAIEHIRSPTTSKMEWWFVATCDCGTRTRGRVSNLKSDTKSCGCLRREVIAERSRTHGESRTPLWEMWQSMFERCKYKSEYLNKGIQVAPVWHDYENFKSYVAQMPKRPSKSYSLDRIDNAGDYEPGNVRWASPKEQARNRDSNTLITVDGETLCVSAWAERLGASSAAIYGRLKRGWSERDAVTKPMRTYAKKS